MAPKDTQQAKNSATAASNPRQCALLLASTARTFPCPSKSHRNTIWKAIKEPCVVATASLDAGPKGRQRATSARPTYRHRPRRRRHIGHRRRGVQASAQGCLAGPACSKASCRRPAGACANPFCLLWWSESPTRLRDVARAREKQEICCHYQRLPACDLPLLSVSVTGL